MTTNTARRQASTTSLAKFARAHSPDPTAGAGDFCNSFWGLGDAGVEVLFARMRGAARTMDELKTYWKERAAIEEDYSKRLGRLAKTALGKDEVGDLRTSFDTLRLETEKQGGYHLQLAQQIRADLEGAVTSFCGRQAHHKKSFQSVIEKNFKAKQTQEAYVDKARQKYETDCMRINAFTAQATLMQGKELEKVQLKLDRARQTVQANQRDFANFARALGDTVRQWEVDWKAFCDSCQDLEDDRMEFLKDNLWGYANAISTVCVSDDVSAEHLRLSLETFEPERDMENFIREYATGNAIPDPPAFVDYNAPDAVPSASARPTSRPADFARSSQRAARDGPGPVPPQPMAQPDPPPEEPEQESVNQAGLGAGGRSPHQHQGSVDNGSINRSQTMSRASNRADLNGHVNGTSPAPGAGPQRRPTQPQYTGRAGPADANAEPIDPNSKTMLKVGANAYEVDLTRDPQTGAPRPGVSPVQNGRPGVGDDSDPLAKQMAELRSGSAMSGGSTNRRRSGVFNQPPGPGGPPQQQHHPGPPSRAPTADSGPSGSTRALGAPPQQRGHAYRNSAEFVVGSYPGAVAGSPPNPPTAAFMSPPAQSPSTMPVEEVMANYQQSFPGEGKRNSRRSSFVSAHSPRPSLSGPPPQQQQMRSPSPNPQVAQQQMLARQPSYADRGRPVSREGHAGIGANGRSTSPFQPVSISRAASPQMQAQRNSFISPPQGGYGAAGQRAPSPNSVGIALDPTGKVAVDQMAERYNQQQRPPPQQPQQQWNQPPPQQGPPQPNNPNRRLSYGMHPGQQQQQQPMQPMQTGYGAPPPPGPSPMYAPPPPPQGQPPLPPHQSGQVQRQQTYNQPPQRQPTYNQQQQQAPPQSAYQPPPPPQQAPPAPPVQQQPQQQLYQPQPQMYPQQPPNGMQPQQTGYYPQQQPVQHQQQASHHSGYGGYNRAPSPNVQAMARSPSPQPPVMGGQGPQQYNGPPPTGQYTEDGKPVLFYVKALYDYQATIEEEFDFQAGDIIAVIATPEDGWWSGELLDEQRRQPRRHVFPSNFVCLF